MKKQLLSLALILTGALVYGQCTFTNGTTDSLNNYLAARSLSWGAMPDTTENLPTATLNQLYSTTLELKWPTNLQAFDSTAPSLSFSSIKIDSVNGLPPGMSFVSPSSTTDDVYCDGQSGPAVTNCDWNSGTYACIKIEGTPNTLGTYLIDVVLSVSHFGGPSEGNFEGYKIVVEPVGVEENDINPFKVKQNVPNPFSSTTVIKYSVKEPTNDAQFYVMNLLGEIVHTQSLETKEGDNAITFDGSNLNEGIYMYTIEISGKKVTKRMIVK